MCEPPSKVRKGVPKTPIGLACSTSQKGRAQCPTVASLQLLQALLWAFSPFLLILRIFFSLPEGGLYTSVWHSIPCDCSHCIKPQSDPILPFQASGARQTQTTLVLSSRLLFFLICPIAPPIPHIHYYLFFLWDLNILGSKGNVF